MYGGISSGSAVVGAIRWIKNQGTRFHKKNVLIVLPDSGNRYLSKVYDDDWMREAGFLDRPSLGTVSDLLYSIRGSLNPHLILAKQSDRVSAVIEQMREQNISQVPVNDAAGWIKGVVTEGAILNALYQGRVKASDSVESLVDPSVEFVTLQDPVEKVSRLVTAGKIPLVNDPNQEQGKLLSIITKIDLLTYLGQRS